MNDYSLILKIIVLWTGFLFFLYVVICKPLIKWRKQRSKKEDNKKNYNFEKEQLFCPKCKSDNVSTTALGSFDVCRVCYNYWAK
jgi:hypothetical protein